MERRGAFRATLTHIWKGTDVLGSGAYGTVYKGYDKRSGEAVAIKAVSDDGGYRARNELLLVQHFKELEFLKTIDHPNIVRLIGAEEELGSASNPSRGTVLVMEYCNAGNLHKLIEEPENALGLDDETFLHIMADLVKGLRHLREVHNLVHRDLKPSNILKTVTADGRVRYKLCDFGAAKVLDDDQPFKSIVGTEEYLHPDIYRRVYGQGEAKSNFDSASDLWSVGVTLYQLATGQLPFQIIGGPRANRRAMLEMTMKKPRGMISGSQEDVGGRLEIQWHDDLPEKAAVSIGLRRFLRPLLADLLEVSHEARLSYADFFNEAERILEMPRTHALHVGTAINLTSYSKDTNLAKVVVAGAEENFDPSAFVAIHEGRRLSWESSAPTGTSPEHPLILLPLERVTIPLEDPASIGLQTQMEDLPMPGAGDPVDDYMWAKCVCGMGHLGRRRLHGLSAALTAAEDATAALAQSLREKLCGLEKQQAAWSLAWVLVSAERKPSHPGVAARKVANAELIAKSQLDVDAKIVEARSALLQLSLPSAHKPSQPDPSGLAILDAALKEGKDKMESFHRDQTLLKARYRPSATSQTSKSGADNEASWHELMKKSMGVQMSRIRTALSGAPFKATAKRLEEAIRCLQEWALFDQRLTHIQTEQEELAAMVSAQQAALGKAETSLASFVTAPPTLTNGETLTSIPRDSTTLVPASSSSSSASSFQPEITALLHEIHKKSIEIRKVTVENSKHAHAALATK